MKSDTIVFFESPDFPRIISGDEGERCVINFTKVLSLEEQEKRFNIFVTNAICPPTYLDCNYRFAFDTNVTSYVFRLNDSIRFPGLLAFQGFAYFDDWGDDYPLESVSRIKPYEFTDVDQILAISSVYDMEKPRNQACLWQFKAPKNYGFKIVVTNLNILNSTNFKIENNHDIIITPSNVRMFFPHYSLDNYLKVYLSKSIVSHKDIFGNYEIELEAYVTIIKNFYIDESIPCVTENRSNIIEWSYWNDKSYPNNARCTFILKILSGTEVLATLKSLNAEENADVINYYAYNNSLPTEMHYPVIFSPEDKKVREVTWEFITDGSIQSRGFKMEFEIKKCSCANSSINVPCTGNKTSYLMNDSHDNGFICGNLKCNFTVSIIHVQSDSFDVFRVISNNITIYQMSNSNPGVSFFHFGDSLRIPSANHNILQAITTLSLDKREVSLSFSALNVSSILPTIIINETKPYFTYDFLKHEKYYRKIPYMFTIKLCQKLINKNATIDLFIFNKYVFNYLTFHKDTNISNRLDFNNCFTEITKSVFKCKTGLKSLTLIQFDVYDNNLLFQVSNEDKNTIGSEGCVFKNNVFVLPYSPTIKTIKITALSNERKFCLIFIFAVGTFYFQELHMSSLSNGSYNIFSGVVERLLVTITPSSVSQWSDLYFVESVYVVEIPINSSIMITGYGNTLYHSNITSAPYKTIVASPTYDILKINSCHSDCRGRVIRSFFIQNTVAHFTVLDMDVLEPNYFYFVENDTQIINITSTLHSVRYESSSFVEVYYYCLSSEHCSIRILLETFADSAELYTSAITTTSALSSTSEYVTTEKSFSLTCTLNYMLLLVQGFCIFEMV